MLEANTPILFAAVAAWLFGFLFGITLSIIVAIVTLKNPDVAWILGFLLGLLCREPKMPKGQ